MARVFVAVWPPADVLDHLVALPRPDHPRVRWLPPATLHVTLRFLGTCEPQEVARRLAAATLPRATARLGPDVSLLGPRVVVVPVDGLEQLAAAVHDATRDLGTPPSDRPFRGHVTLARCRDDEAGAAVVGARVRHAFDVDEVAVVTSRTQPDGARYTTRARLAVG